MHFVRKGVYGVVCKPELSTLLLSLFEWRNSCSEPEPRTQVLLSISMAHRASPVSSFICFINFAYHNLKITHAHLTPGGKAAQSGVGVGDSVVSIGNANAEEMTHVEAQNQIRAATDSLTLTLNRSFPSSGGQKTSPSPPSWNKYSFTPSTSINKMARPFSASANNSSAGPVIKPVAYAPKLNSSANNASTPVSDSMSTAQNGRGEMYYEDFYPDAKHGLRAENVPCFIPNDRSKKRLIQDTQDWQPRTGTTQSRSFRILAQLTGTDYMQDPDDETMKRSREKFLTEIQSPRYARLRDWHHDRSARSLNVKS
ncbi:PDZ and LIM domain protein 7 [Bagarius yarrelli]|uniref:PDZ and LIM domain protein 7 n=1 Tax=Bagarius yarrelli TaxID=175774 RepID=A0A556TVF3_BAGYA|nr:PDZ and LIM domain protein 7 [Bagarius yarrelli]